MTETTSIICGRCGQRNSALNPSCLACDGPLDADAAAESDRTSGSESGVLVPGTAAPGERSASPDHIAHFRLIDLLGAGGMGEVYRAYDENLDRLVALKIIRPDQLERLEALHREAASRRFIDEAQMSGRLDHPNIVPIYELGDDHGTVFFSMKLVQGKTLADSLRAMGEVRFAPQRLAELLRHFIKVCEALSFAHDRGVIHRDLKPANILIGDFGQVYLMDWGAALLLSRRHEAAPKTRLEISREESSFGSIVGTLRYMSPEQARGERTSIDNRTDVFALGATLYQILTGQPPYIAKNLRAILRQAQDGALDRAPLDTVADRVPPRLAEIALRAMARDRDERYAAVSELQQDVQSFLDGAWKQPLQTFTAGHAIIRQGDEADAAYILNEGRCAVVDTSEGRRKVLRELGPGDVFGEAAIFSAARRTATVEALDDVKVTVVTRQDLTTGVGLNSSLGRFVKTLADRFAELDQRVRENGRDEGPNSKTSG